MKTEEMKQSVFSAIDENREHIIRTAQRIWHNPELGFKEFKTADYVKETFSSLGIPYEEEIAVTGVKGMLKGSSGGFTAAYLGELDSIIVRDHPEADPASGAVHACGHNAQIASLLALAYGLSKSGIMQHLSGAIALIAVPAEEYVEIDYRLGLRKKGTIEFLGGKPEFIRLGAFDDIDFAMLTHLYPAAGRALLGINGPSNGCVVKQVRFLGRAAHAGAAPDQGINALKAALIALSAIDANREGFRDEDHIRVHPIITKGGELVNVVPSEAELETFVRGADIEAVDKAADTVDRCCKAGAAALGAEVLISSFPGYLPRIYHEAATGIIRKNIVSLVGEESCKEPEFGAGSTDMGDLSHIMPAFEIGAYAAGGTGHGADYKIQDEETAYLLPAKLAAAVYIDLLSDDGSGARQLIDRFEPRMSKNEYLNYMRSLFKEERWSI
jgi:amidohydrolase